MGTAKAGLPWPRTLGGSELGISGSICRTAADAYPPKVRGGGGQTLLGHAVWTLRSIVEEVLVVARPRQTLPVHSARVAVDRIPGAGPLGGLEAGLAAMKTPYGMVVACDMPWLSSALLRAMARLAPGWDLVIPRLFGRYQPLHAVYAKGLQPIAARLLGQGERRVHALVSRVRALVLDEEILRAYDPSLRSLQGLNDWGSYQRAAG